MTSDLQKLWQEVHRGRLHCLDSWRLEGGGLSASPSLTYIPSGAGATGSAQLQRFTTLFPSEHHPFNMDQIARYNNQHHVVSCVVADGARTVVEEIAISALHQGRWDYLMPGVEATHLTFAIPFVLVARYAREVDLLEEVRVYWDQATLLKQLGVFQLAFHNSIKINEPAFENGLAMLPIMDGMKASRRLAHPTPHNCNQLITLEGLEAAKQNPSAQPRHINLSPSNHSIVHETFSPSSSPPPVIVGGLDNIAELAHQLPHLPLKDSQHSHTLRPMAHLTSSVFDPPASLNALGQGQGHHHETRHIQGLTSTLKLGDGSADPVRPLATPLKARPTFGENWSESVHVRPSVAIDPHRNESRVFAADDSAFVTKFPQTDQSRFASSIFAPASDTQQAVGHPEHRRACPTQLKSHILGGGEVADEHLANQGRRLTTGIATKSSCPFSTDAEPTLPAQPAHAAGRRTTHLSGHFHGSSFDQDEPLETKSFSGLQSDGRTNRSTFSLAAGADEIPRSAVCRRAATTTQSSLQLGDSPAELIAARPSSRVLQPPGGHSSIFLE